MDEPEQFPPENNVKSPQETHNFSREEILWALKLCPYTSYRIAAETGITQATIQNYRTGRSKPSPNITRQLYQYLRLAEYYPYHHSLGYLEFVEQYGLRPLVQPRHTTVGFIDGYTPTEAKDTLQPLQPVNFPKQSPQDEELLKRGGKMNYSETEEIELEAREQMDALHALVLSQKKTIDRQLKEIAKLKEENARLATSLRAYEGKPAES